jgi:hypothetical protein
MGGTSVEKHKEYGCDVEEIVAMIAKDGITTSHGRTCKTYIETLPQRDYQLQRCA